MIIIKYYKKALESLKFVDVFKMNTSGGRLGNVENDRCIQNRYIGKMPENVESDRCIHFRDIENEYTNINSLNINIYLIKILYLK